MSLKLKIDADIKTAMLAKDSVTKDILRVFKGEIERNEQTSKGKIELTDSDISKIAKKLIEGIRESKQDNGEIAILEGYVLKQLSNDEIMNIAMGVKEGDGLTTLKEMGLIMKYFKENYDGQYDGKYVTEVAKQILS